MAAFLIIAGIFVRVLPTSQREFPGPDEHFYRTYVKVLSANGLSAYPQLFRDYVDHLSKKESSLVLPPGRVTFISAAVIWSWISGNDALTSVHRISAFASSTLLVVAGVFAWRLGGSVFGIGVLALFACAPLQIYLAQRALIDGMFALMATLAIWFFWECLQKPNDRRWLYLYVVALVLTVLTKENAAFVWCAIMGILLMNRWVKIGNVSRSLVIATIAGPLVGVLFLFAIAGGISSVIEAYRLNAEKSYLSPYAIQTGDGPMHRYFLDMFTLNPLVMLFAVGGLFEIRQGNRALVFLGLFTLITYIVMGNLRYGINLRYGSIWDFPVCYMAFSALLAITCDMGRWKIRVLWTAVCLLCIFELTQYWKLFVQAAIYDPTPEPMLRALEILKRN